jgi:hypothetical protein
MRYVAERRNLPDAIADLREIAGGRRHPGPSREPARVHPSRLTQGTREIDSLPECGRRIWTESASHPFILGDINLEYRQHTFIDPVVFNHDLLMTGVERERQIRLQDQIERQDQNRVCTSPSTIS